MSNLTPIHPSAPQYHHRRRPRSTGTGVFPPQQAVGVSAASAEHGARFSEPIGAPAAPFDERPTAMFTGRPVGGLPAAPPYESGATEGASYASTAGLSALSDQLDQRRRGRAAVAASTARLSSIPAAAGSSVAPEKIARIREVFPDMPEDQIRTALQLNGGSVETTCEQLIQSAFG